MSTLVVNEIVNSLEQEFTFNLNTRSHIGAFYPYLVMINSPVGIFTFKLFKGATELFSVDFTSIDISTESYAHVFFPIIPEKPIQLEKGQYKISITTSGYTKTNDSYIGWIQQFEDIQNEMSYTPVRMEENSLAFRLKIYKEGIV